MNRIVIKPVFNYVIALLFVCCSILPTATHVHAQNATLFASQDTFVDPNNPSTSYDAGQEGGGRLEIGYSNFPSFSGTRYSLLRFNLASLSTPLVGSPLVLQVVENHLTQSGSSVNAALYVVDDSWDETVTADSAPTAGSLLQTISIPFGFTGQVRFDAAGVGSYLETERTGDQVASFLLRINSGSGDLSFVGSALFEDHEGSANGINGDEPFIEWTPWSGTGHFVALSVGYTPSGYNAQPNFRQASTFTNAANSIISTADTTDLFVNFDYNTSGKTIYLVYTTNGTAPTKNNGTVVTASFSNYAAPNSFWRASIPAQPADTVVNYVFYASDNTLASGWGRISGTSSARSTSQYQTTWSETDNAYFSFQVNGTADNTSQIGKTRTSVVWDATPNPTYSTLGSYTLTFNFVNNSGKTLRNISYRVTAATKAFLMNPSDGVPGGVGKEINLANSTLPNGDSLYQSDETLTGQQYQVGVTGSGWKLTLAIYAVDNTARRGMELIDTIEIDGQELEARNQSVFLPVMLR